MAPALAAKTRAGDERAPVVLIWAAFGAVNLKLLPAVDAPILILPVA